MKNANLFFGIVIGIFLQSVFITSNAQNPVADKSGLVGSAWELVANVADTAQHDKTLYFKKNFTFETRNVDGSVFNNGKYSIIDSQTFVTVHTGSHSASLYNFSVVNDTLHFKGHYIDDDFNALDKKIGFSNIDEIWVKKSDWVEKNEGIQFVEVATLADALEISATQSKIIFMDCYTTWCGPCKFLVNNIFPIKEVGELYNDKFVNVSFDMESTEGKKIAAKYGIKAYPTLLFLNSKGEIEHMSIGAGGAETLIQKANTALDSNRNLKAIQLKIKNGDRNAETLISYLSTNYYADDKKALLADYFRNKTSEQRLSEDSWKLFVLFDEDTESEQFKYFVKHRAMYIKKYGKKDVESKIWEILNSYMRDSVKYKSLQKVDAALYLKHKIYADYQNAEYKFYTDKKNKAYWNDLLKKAGVYYSQKDIDAMDINNFCWFVYENYKTFNDTVALKMVNELSYKSYQLKSDDIQINDTYAHILFDLGFVEDAIKHEEFALKRGQELKSNSVKFFADELAKFKKALH